jgi:hypothetical protein
MHIPKCGGTSLLRGLRKWFWPWRVVAHYRREMPPPPSPIKVSGKMVVHGHFNGGGDYGVLRYYPQARQFITFLREPFDRYVSLWHFMPKVAPQNRPGWLERRGDFATELRRHARQQRERRNSESLIWHFPEATDVAGIEAQMDRSYVFVGVMERYQQSLDALAKALGKRRIAVSRLNTTEYEEDEYERWRPFYRKHFADEYAVYEAALRRNDRLLKRYL